MICKTPQTPNKKPSLIAHNPIHLANLSPNFYPNHHPKKNTTRPPPQLQNTLAKKAIKRARHQPSKFHPPAATACSAALPPARARKVIRRRGGPYFSPKKSASLFMRGGPGAARVPRNIIFNFYYIGAARVYASAASLTCARARPEGSM